MKVAVFDSTQWDTDYLDSIFDGHDVRMFEESINDVDLSGLSDVEAVAIFISSKITREVLDQLPNLKLVTTMSTGFDHVDREACNEKGLTVCNVPHYGENTVAEHAFSLILALARKLYPSIKRTREDHEFHTDESLRGFDLKGKTLGIVGCGNIGKHVASIARGFQMNTLVFDVQHDEFLAEEMGFEYVDMDALLAESDIITLHVPYMEQTHHIIDEEAIGKMKEGVLIINTARGALIDTNALVKGLSDGKVGGAGLDVLEGEETIDEEAELLDKDNEHLQKVLENHMLMRRDNVIVTPHNAFNSKEALRRIMQTTVDNIDKFEAGNAQNTVN